MTDWVEGEVPKDEMIQPEDIAEAVRFLLRTSRNCVVPEVQFVRPGDQSSDHAELGDRTLVLVEAVEQTRQAPLLHLARHLLKLRQLVEGDARLEHRLRVWSSRSVAGRGRPRAPV